MNKKELNYIFINPNQSPEKQKRLQSIISTALAQSTCKKYLEETNRSLNQNKSINNLSV